eukprot:SAG25_NODE_392_length_8604_cov_13.605879_3_plen_182_part_00
MAVLTMVRRVEPGVILNVQLHTHLLWLVVHGNSFRNQVPLHRMQPSHNRGAWYPPVAHERRLLTHLDWFEMRVYGQVPAGTGVNNSGMEGNRSDIIHLAHNRRIHRRTPTTAGETDGCGCHGDAHLTDLDAGPRKQGISSNNSTGIPAMLEFLRIPTTSLRTVSVTDLRYLCTLAATLPPS